MIKSATASTLMVVVLLVAVLCMQLEMRSGIAELSAGQDQRNAGFDRMESRLIEIEGYLDILDMARDLTQTP